MHSATTPQIERVTLGELLCWRLRTAQAELLVAQQGAQVLSYQQHGQPPLIWLSEHAAYQQGQSVRGGVPVCWPWFGDLGRNPPAVQALLADPGGAPFHGGVRTLDWQLLAIEPDAEGVSLQFACPPPGTAANWPIALELQLSIRLDQRLHISLTSHNSGDAPLCISQALHSYFAVSDIRQVEVQELAGCRYIETLDDWQPRQQQGPLRFNGETDRIYQDLPARLSILDHGWQRRVHLQSHGSSSAVLWNPWSDKAERLSNFAEDAWQRMLCIETANVWDDCRQLAAGASHSLGVTLWSEPL
jgi:glucose-6-phosphate 1-epimerase